MIAEFTIPGPPQGKARPRVTRNGTYTPQKTKDYMELVRWCYKAGGCPVLNGNIRASVLAYFQVPKRTSKKLRALMLSGEVGREKIRVDADNLAKIIMDGLNGLAYDDDRQVVELTVKKYYAEEARVEVRLEEIR